MSLTPALSRDEQSEQDSAPGSENGATTSFRGFLDKYFYFSMALLCVAIKSLSVLHTPGYAANDIEKDSVFNPEASRPLILWIHNAAFSAWLAFFVVQSALVRVHKIEWHRFFGWFGVALAMVMVPVGIATAIAKSRPDAGSLIGTDTESYLIISFYNMLAFGVFIALAIWWRKEPELLRRLIFIATCGLLDTAFISFDNIINPHLFFLAIDLMIVLGVLRDLFVDRRVHRVYFIALPALIVTQVFVTYTWLENSAWWIRIAHAIIG